MKTVSRETKVKKSPALLLTTFSLWSASLVIMGQPLLPIIASAENGIQLLTLSIFTGLLVFFWLLSSYYLSLVIFFTLKRILKRGEKIGSLVGEKDTPVAVLYTTCNDFQLAAVSTCLYQDYEDYQVFILDDSDDQEFKSQIDDFASLHSDRVRVVRRPGRNGHKAGNLNNALRHISKDYPLFAVLDADEKLPSDFLIKTVYHIERTGTAFVQAKHIPDPAQASAFAKSLNQSILPFWAVLLDQKNEYGYTPCVGHGILVRSSSWEKAGGFPEILSEDLGFAAKLLEIGEQGYYASDVACQEEFPTSYRKFEKQQQRYVSGVLDALIKLWPTKVLPGRCSWIEKIDFVLCCLPLYVPVLCLIFIVTAGLGIPLCFARYSEVVMHTGFGRIAFPFVQSFDSRFEAIWNPYFISFSLFFSICPALPTLALAFSKQIRNPLRLIVWSNVIQMATMVSSLGAIITHFMRGAMPFIPTGADAVTSRSKGGIFRNIALNSLGIGLIVLLLSSLNLGLAALAICPILVRHFSIEKRRFKILACAILSAIFIQGIAGMFLSLHSAIMPPFLFSIHF